MRVIKFKIGEVKFLKEECKSPILNSFLNIGLVKENMSLELTLTTDELEKFEEELYILLMANGIDDNGELNNFGKSVDDLIGRVNFYDDD